MVVVLNLRLAVARQKWTVANPPMMQKVEGFNTETEACGGRAKVDGREPTNDAESEGISNLKLGLAGFSAETETSGFDFGSGSCRVRA